MGFNQATNRFLGWASQGAKIAKVGPSMQALIGSDLDNYPMSPVGKDSYNYQVTGKDNLFIIIIIDLMFHVPNQIHIYIYIYLLGMKGNRSKITCVG